MLGQIGPNHLIYKIRQIVYFTVVRLANPQLNRFHSSAHFFLNLGFLVRPCSRAEWSHRRWLRCRRIRLSSRRRSISSHLSSGCLCRHRNRSLQPPSGTSSHRQWRMLCLFLSRRSSTLLSPPARPQPLRRVPARLSLCGLGICSTGWTRIILIPVSLILERCVDVYSLFKISLFCFGVKYFYY